jgi:hypothetical protein
LDFILFFLIQMTWTTSSWASVLVFQQKNSLFWPQKMGFFFLNLFLLVEIWLPNFHITKLKGKQHPPLTCPPFDWHLIVNIHSHAMDQVLLIAHLPHSSLMTSIQTLNYFLVLCFAIEWGLLCSKELAFSLSFSFGVLPLSS